MDPHLLKLFIALETPLDYYEKAPNHQLYRPQDCVYSVGRKRGNNLRDIKLGYRFLLKIEINELWVVSGLKMFEKFDVKLTQHNSAFWLYFLAQLLPVDVPSDIHQLWLSKMV